MFWGLKITCVIKRAARPCFAWFGQSSTRSQWQSRNLTSEHLSSTLISWDNLTSLPNEARAKSRRYMRESWPYRLDQTCHEPLLTCGPWQFAGGHHAHTSSPSQTGASGTISRLLQRAQGSQTRPSPRWSREITNSILRWKIFIYAGAIVNW